MSIEATPRIKSNKIEKILYFLAALTLPNIFLFNLYSRNRETAEIAFHHVLILAVILAFVSVIILLLMRFAIRNYEGALLTLLLFWLSFWLFESIYGIIPNRILTPLNRPVFTRGLLLVGMLVLIIGLAVFLRLKAIPLYKGRAVFNALLAVICLLFVFNAFPMFVASFASASSGNDGDSSVFYIKREFNVDSSLPSPDIYWIMMDGMINFHSMETFFDQPQDELRQELVTRGFVINENAEFIGNNTTYGMPGLFSPALYDSYLGALYMEGRYLLRSELQPMFNQAFARDGISLADEIAPYHELFHAFLQAGYSAVMIANFSPNVYTPIDRFYRIGDEAVYDRYPFTVKTDSETGGHLLRNVTDLLELLTIMTPFSLFPNFVTEIREGNIRWEAIPDHTEAVDRLTETTKNLHHERQLYRSLIDSFSISEPKLLFITPMFTHAHYWHLFDETLEEWTPSRYDLYPIAREYGVNVMMKIIDMILERNPEAIIVIQSDHGMHARGTQRQLLADGYSNEVIRGLHNSVMSAVRIPEQYGGLDEPLDPRNITRELVNRFVGENYELLPQ